MTDSQRSGAQRSDENQEEGARAPWPQDGHLRHERKPLRRDPPPRREIPPTCEVLHLRLAEELDYARRLLTAMGNELAADAPVVVRHGIALQSVDVVGQMLTHIAGVIRSSDPMATVARIGMAELKARLSRTSLD